eukprot:1161490-Pelagomonas_calceolata.AAC.9
MAQSSQLSSDTGMTAISGVLGYADLLPANQAIVRANYFVPFRCAQLARAVDIVSTAQKALNKR